MPRVGVAMANEVGIYPPRMTTPWLVMDAAVYELMVTVSQACLPSPKHRPVKSINHWPRFR